MKVPAYSTEHMKGTLSPNKEMPANYFAHVQSALLQYYFTYLRRAEHLSVQRSQLDFMGPSPGSFVSNWGESIVDSDFAFLCRTKSKCVKVCWALEKVGMGEGPWSLQFLSSVIQEVLLITM